MRKIAAAFFGIAVDVAFDDQLWDRDRFLRAIEDVLAGTFVYKDALIGSIAVGVGLGEWDSDRSGRDDCFRSR